MKYEKYWKVSLVDLNERKILQEKNFFLSELPSNIDQEYSWNFTYYWIINHFFEDYIIIDCQYGNANTEKGYPDFKVISKDLKEKIYVEFKSPKDALSHHQLMWYLSKKHKKFLILCCEEKSGYFDQDGNEIDEFIVNRTNTIKELQRKLNQ